MLFSNQSLVYSCFNCGFRARYDQGDFFSSAFIKLLQWLQFDEHQIGEFRVQALAQRQNSGDLTITPPPQRDCVPLPAQAQRLTARDHPAAWQYLQCRAIDPNISDFYVCTGDPLLANRIIVPVRQDQQILGYVARSITQARPKYIRQLNQPSVLGLDWQRPQYTWVPVMEGVFDALSIRGCATLGNQLNSQQATLLNSLNKRIIVVPDQDAAGESLALAALEQGWSVSICDWPSGVKDVNDAVVKYGTLFVLRTIWNSATDNALKIRIKLRGLGKT